MTPNDSSVMASSNRDGKLITASGVSIFKISFGLLLYFLSLFLINLTSLAVLRKLHPTRFAFLAINGITFRSTLVSASKLIWVSGRFRPFSFLINGFFEEILVIFRWLLPFLLITIPSI